MVLIQNLCFFNWMLNIDFGNILLVFFKDSDAFCQRLYKKQMTLLVNGDESLKLTLTCLVRSSQLLPYTEKYTLILR